MALRAVGGLSVDGDVVARLAGVVLAKPSGDEQSNHMVSWMRFIVCGAARWPTPSVLSRREGAWD